MTKYGSALLDDNFDLEFVEGNAQYLPFEDESLDLYIQEALSKCRIN